MTAWAPTTAVTERGVPGFGMELRLNLAGCDPRAIDSRDELAAYVTLLVEKIGMTAYGAPILVNFGEGDLAGWTVVQLITTSNITMHLAPADRTAYLNIFSCRYFDPDVATAFTLDFFGASAYTSDVTDRTAPRVEH